jgi:hypothetical protein
MVVRACQMFRASPALLCAVVPGIQGGHHFGAAAICQAFLLSYYHSGFE